MKIVDEQIWLLVPIIIVTINYIVFSLAWVHVSVVIQPFTMPIGLSGFIATSGDLHRSLLQFFDLIVSAIIYYPFFKAWERVLVAREETANQQEEDRATLKSAQIQRSIQQNPVDAASARKEV